MGSPEGGQGPLVISILGARRPSETHKSIMTRLPGEVSGIHVSLKNALLDPGPFLDPFWPPKRTPLGEKFVIFGGPSGICRVAVGVCRESVGDLSGIFRGICRGFDWDLSGVCRGLSGICRGLSRICRESFGDLSGNLSGELSGF